MADDRSNHFAISDWREIADRVFVCQATPETVSVGAVFGQKHALLIDTGSCPTQGHALAMSIRQKYEREVDRIIITHSHFDHWFGLAGIPAAKSFGHVGLYAEARECPDTETAYQFGFSPELIVAPTTLISDSTTISLGKRRIEMYHFGPGHTNTDLLVRVPDADVIFAGDLVEESGPPRFDPSATISAWPRALTELLGLCTANTIVVPGHGKPVDRGFVAAQRDQIDELFRRGHDLQYRGVALQEALQSIDATWPFDLDTCRDALVLVYAEVANWAH